MGFLRYFILFAFLLFGCSADWERDHPYDQKAANYIGAGGSSSSASPSPSSNSTPSSSSISISSSSASSYSSAVSSSSAAQSSSSIRSSSSVTPSSSSAAQSSGAGGGYTGSYGTLNYGGQSYKTVKIGDQTWMAENLNVAHNSGNGNSVCYNYQESNCGTYGRLYNWAAAMDLPSSCNSSSCASQVQSNHRGLCPEGWHIPSDSEWTTLTDYVGGSSVAGKKLKATSGWDSNGNGTDDFGFSALPGGYRYSDGDFYNAGYYGNWWSASEYAAGYAYYRDMYYIGGNAYWYGSDESYGYSVRCVQDSVP
jgi:uncharacterized protein (TIGR02145 family)